MKWYFHVLRNYATFAGRARRKEYWDFGLIHVLIINLILFFVFMTEDSQPGENRYGPNPKTGSADGTVALAG